MQCILNIFAPTQSLSYHPLNHSIPSYPLYFFSLFSSLPPHIEFSLYCLASLWIETYCDVWSEGN